MTLNRIPDHDVADRDWEEEWCPTCGGDGFLIAFGTCVTCDSPPEYQVACHECGGWGKVAVDVDVVLSYTGPILPDELEEVPLWVYDLDQTLVEANRRVEHA